MTGGTKAAGLTDETSLGDQDAVTIQISKSEIDAGRGSLSAAPQMPIAREARYVVRAGYAVTGILHRLEAEDSPCSVQVVDLSRNGVKVLSPVCVPFGDRIRIALSVEGEEHAIQIAGEVRWLRETPEHQWQIGCSLMSGIEDELLQKWGMAGILERRRSQRRQTDFPIQMVWELNPTPVSGEVVNISHEGVCIRCDSPGAAESRVKIVLPNAHGEDQSTPAEIRWCVEDAGHYLLGCKLVNPEDYLLFENAAEQSRQPLAPLKSHSRSRSSALVGITMLMATGILGACVYTLNGAKQANLTSAASPAAQQTELELAQLQQSSQQFEEKTDSHEPRPREGHEASPGQEEPSLDSSSTANETGKAKHSADASPHDMIVLTPQADALPKLDEAVTQIQELLQTASLPRAHSVLTPVVKEENSRPDAVGEELAIAPGHSEGTIAATADPFKAACQLLEEGKIDEAQKALMRVIRTHKDSAEVWYSLAMAQHAKGRDAVALRSFRIGFEREMTSGCDTSRLPRGPDAALAWLQALRDDASKRRGLFP